MYLHVPVNWQLIGYIGFHWKIGYTILYIIGTRWDSGSLVLLYNNTISYYILLHYTALYLHILVLYTSVTLDASLSLSRSLTQILASLYDSQFDGRHISYICIRTLHCIISSFLIVKYIFLNYPQHARGWRSIVWAHARGVSSDVMMTSQAASPLTFWFPISRFKTFSRWGVIKQLEFRMLHFAAELLLLNLCCGSYAVDLMLLILYAAVSLRSFIL